MFGLFANDTSYNYFSFFLFYLHLQQPDGVRVPDVLVPFMGGRTFLPFVKERPAPPKIDSKSATTTNAASSSSTSGANTTN